MTKKQLIDSIEAYAAAKQSGNLTLIQMSAHALKSALDALPEEFLPPAATTELKEGEG